MLASHRPVIDGLDNVIGYDTFDADGKLVRRFNTEDEAIDFLVERDKPYVDPRFNTEDEAIDFLVERDKPYVDPRTAPAETDEDPAE